MADNKYKIHMKIAIVGDPRVGKSTFVDNYIKSSNDGKSVDPFRSPGKQEYKRFEKVINHNKFTIDVYEFSMKNDKILGVIACCNAVLLMFDLNNRTSFENINDYWLNFLRDYCCFQNDIYLLGNYQNKSSNPLTQIEEINEMIKFSNVAATYIETGNKGIDDLNNLTDNLIAQTYENEKKNLKAKSKEGSMKIDRCIIF